MKKLLVVVLAVVMVFCFAACGGGSDEPTEPADDQTEAREFSFGSVVAATTTGGKSEDLFASKVNELSNGALKVNVFHDGQLGNNNELLEQIQLGTLDMCFASAANVSVFTKAGLIFDVPYMWSCTEAAIEAQTGELGKMLAQEITDEVDGFHALGWAANGWRELTANKEVTKPEDMKGLKIRLMDNEVHMACWGQFGASPMTMAFSEIYTGLQQGTIDCQENPLNLIFSQSLFDVQDYVIMTDHVYDPVIILMSEKTWDSLTEDEQAIFQQAADETGVEVHKIIADDAAELRGVLEEKGMTFIDLTPEQKAAFKDALKPVYEKYIPIIGEEKWSMAEEINAKYN